MITPQELGEIADFGQIKLKMLDDNNFDDHFPVRGSALGNCDRQLALLSSGMPRTRPTTAHQERVFQVGHQREDALLESMAMELRDRGLYFTVQERVLIPTNIVGVTAAEIFNKALAYVDDGILDENDKPRSGFWKRKRVPLALEVDDGVPRLYIKGSCDLVIYDMQVEWIHHSEGTGTGPYGWHARDVDGFRNLAAHAVCIVDTKTKHPWGMKKLDTEGVDNGYGLQLAGYGKALEARGHKDVSMLVYYESKGDQTRKILPVDWVYWRQAVADQVEAKENVMLAFLADEQAAVGESFFPKTDKKGGIALPWQCNYCALGPVAGKCHANYNWHNSVADQSKPPKWVGIKK